MVHSIELYALKVYIEGCDKNRQAMYRYLLLESRKEIEYFDKKIEVPCFGVAIVREDIEDGKVCSVESDRIEWLTTYRYKAVQILKKLYENNVSPIHLVDIVGPIADEWVSDFDESLRSTAVQ